jgi:hypothetical protein
VAQFKDDEGREWELRFDHSLMRTIHKRLRVNLHNTAEQAKAIDRMAEDIELLVNVLYLLCKEQCDSAGVSDEEFGKGFGTGETFDRANSALMEALLSFTSPQRRDLAKRTMSLTLGVRTRAEELVGTILTKAMDETTKALTSGV